MHFIYKQSGNFDCIIMQVWNLVYVYHHNPQTEKIWLWLWLDYSNTLVKKIHCNGLHQYGLNSWFV